MNLRITTTNGAIGINTTPGKMNIEYGKSNFNMQVENPRINLNITQPKVKIDQTKPLAEIGIKKITDFIKTNAQKSKRVCSEGIDRIVQQGNELARIETGNNPISSQAKYNAFERSKKEVNIDFIPKSMPEISLEEGRVDINFQKGDVSVQAKQQEVDINYSVGKVSVYLKQKPFIDIEYVGNSLDFKI